jgi:methionyl-tRNA formyltransferase
MSDPTTLPREDKIDWRQSADKIVAFIDTLNSPHQLEENETSAKATINNQTIAIHRARAGGTMSSYPPGTITRCDERLWVQTGRGHLEMESILIENEELDAAEYFTRHGFAPGDMFDRSHVWIESPMQGRSRDAA